MSYVSGVGGHAVRAAVIQREPAMSIDVCRHYILPIEGLRPALEAVVEMHARLRKRGLIPLRLPVGSLIEVPSAYDDILDEREVEPSRSTPRHASPCSTTSGGKATAWSSTRTTPTGRSSSIRSSSSCR